MLFREVDLTTALRPSLWPDETLLYVQDAVGLYEGKYKIPNYQNGQAYLTSHRACYVDNEEPRKYSVGIHLKDVDRSELYAGFLKSSAKITLFPKPTRRTTLYGSGNQLSPNETPPLRQPSPFRSSVPSPTPPTTVNANWVCPICSFSNPVPSNFDPATANAHTPLPPCLACGIKPPVVLVIKAAINAMSNRQSGYDADALAIPSIQPSSAESSTPDSSKGIRCPRCTFENHPSLNACEICNTSLLSASNKRLDLAVQHLARSESPGPSMGGLSINDEVTECIKFSFRAGGEKAFNEHLRSALIQRKWLLQSAPPVPKAVSYSNGQNGGQGHNSQTGEDNHGAVGIAGLERRRTEMRRNNELVIGNAFEDLEALMTSAKEVIALAEQFASQAKTEGDSSDASQVLSQSASALGLVTTRDMLGSGSASDTLYISELSRNLAEFLTDDTKGILKREGGIISLVDLWAVFNRARGGVELVSPNDFEKAAQLWDKLKLPVRLRKFKSGLYVVQGRDRTDEKTIQSILAWLQELHDEPPSEDCPWDWLTFGKGVTAQETAARFGWSVGVASEELEMAEENGALCREQRLDGLRFWENWLVHTFEETEPTI